MKELPKIAMQRHDCYSYIDVKKYDLDNILNFVKSRSRFSEVNSIIEKIDNCQSDDFYTFFNKRFIINAQNNNDAYIATIALYYATLKKLCEIDDIDDDDLFSHYDDYIVELSSMDMVSTSSQSMFFGDLNQRNTPQDDLSENLSISETHFIEIFNALNLSQISDSLEQLEGFVFLICTLNPIFLTSDNNTDSNENDELKIKGTELGYVYMKIGVDTPDDLNQIMISRFDEMGFDISDCKNELEKYCSTIRQMDEYHINIMMKSVINQWLFSGNTNKIITKKCINELLEAGINADKNKMSGNDSQNTTQIVGLKREMNKIDGIIKMLVFDNRRRSVGINTSFNGCNMVFAGPPGTAKTSLARLFAKKLAQSGIIRSASNFKECRKSDLTGMYVGWTAAKVDKMFSDMYEAGGGVIFFDEIYTLSENNKTSFDTEAITCIVQNMENYRKNVFCIFAGYEDKMDEFLSANPGIRSRVQFNVKFSGYDNQTLIEITKSICTSCGFLLPRNSTAILNDYFDILRSIRGAQFGNGREARNLVSNAAQKMAVRLWDTKNLSVKQLKTLTLKDIHLAAEDILSSEIKISGGSRKIGF